MLPHSHWLLNPFGSSLHLNSTMSPNPEATGCFPSLSEPFGSVPLRLTRGWATDSVYFAGRQRSLKPPVPPVELCHTHRVSVSATNPNASDPWCSTSSTSVSRTVTIASRNHLRIWSFGRYSNYWDFCSWKRDGRGICHFGDGVCCLIDNDSSAPLVPTAKETRLTPKGSQVISTSNGENLSARLIPYGSLKDLNFIPTFQLRRSGVIANFNITW